MISITVLGMVLSPLWESRPEKASCSIQDTGYLPIRTCCSKDGYSKTRPIRLRLVEFHLFQLRFLVNRRRRHKWWPTSSMARQPHDSTPTLLDPQEPATSSKPSFRRRILASRTRHLSSSRAGNFPSPLFMANALLSTSWLCPVSFND